ncbi:hypothetical protein CPC08DRAFT_722206 [Agrocybe pediades]|nr:hypothetical protein CPC08DRAFT_722206 [Agrocybe pediades]
MNFKSLVAFVTLAAPAMVFASPVAEGAEKLHARVITQINVVPKAGGEYNRIAGPKPKDPGVQPAPKSCPNKVMAEWYKLTEQCTDYDKMKYEFDNDATPAIRRTIMAAEAKGVPLSGDIRAEVISRYHEHLKSDKLMHWTFKFAFPAVCGAGECSGHAYLATAPEIGKIFDAAHRVVFEVILSLSIQIPKRQC